MSSEFMVEQIARAWKFDPSKRTILYYAFLLARASLRKKDKEHRDIKVKLRDMVSVESGDFDAIIHEFVFFSIMKSEETCELNEDAIVEIEGHLHHCLRETDPVPFDGLQIYQAKPDRRFHLWVEQGSKYIMEIFSGVPELKFRSIEVGRKRGRLLIMQTDIHHPFIIIYFINTHRMKQMSELEPLFACSEEFLFQRMRELQKYGQTASLDSFKSINIAAAPTYSSSTADEAANSEIPTRLIGPINLAIIGKYFLHDRPCCREEQYKAFLEYLDPVNGGMRGGIIFSTWLEQYLEQRLRDIYKQNNCFPES